MIILSGGIVNNRYNNDYPWEIRRRWEECEKKIECENKNEKMKIFLEEDFWVKIGIK